jgi:hypothetical protein
MSDDPRKIQVRFLKVGIQAKSWDAELSRWHEAAIGKELRKKHAWPERGTHIQMGFIEAELRSQSGRLVGTVQRKYTSGGKG